MKIAHSIMSLIVVLSTLPVFAVKTTAPTIYAAQYFTASSTSVRMTAENGATIYYTTDGTTPTSNSQQYVGLFQVSSSCTIKAIAVCEGRENSSVKSCSVSRLSSSGSYSGQHNIYYDSDGGTTYSYQTAYDGWSYSYLPVPTREDGDEFLGWYVDGSKITSSSHVSGPRDIVLRAKWLNVDRYFDPDGLLHFEHDVASGSWSEEYSSIRWTSSAKMGKGVVSQLAKFTVLDDCIVVVDAYSAECDLEVRVDGQIPIQVSKKYEVRGAGTHEVTLNAVGRSDDNYHGCPKVTFYSLSTNALPQTVEVYFYDDASWINLTFDTDAVYGDLPLPDRDVEGCTFEGWFYGTMRITPEMQVSALCTSVEARWKPSGEFVNYGGLSDSEFNSKFVWRAYEYNGYYYYDYGSYAYCEASDEVGQSEVLFRATVHGRGVLRWRHQVENCYIAVDGSDVTDRVLTSVCPEEGRDVLWLAVDIPKDGTHEVTVRVRTTEVSDWYYVYPMSWQPVGDSVEMSFDPTFGAMSDPTNGVYRYDGIYGNLPTPVCEWGDFIGWASQAEEWMDDPDWYSTSRPYFWASNATPVTAVYTNLVAKWRLTGRLLDPNGLFDISFCDHRWRDEEEIKPTPSPNSWDPPRYYSQTWHRYASWSMSFEEVDGAQECVVMRFRAEHTGFLCISNVCLSSSRDASNEWDFNWCRVNPIYAYVRKCAALESAAMTYSLNYYNSYYSQNSLEAYRQWDSYRRGACWIQTVAGEEYEIAVKVESGTFGWRYNGYTGPDGGEWVSAVRVNLKVGEFYFKPQCKVVYLPGEHGSLRSNRWSSSLIERYEKWVNVGERWQNGQDEPYVEALEGWEFIGWNTEDCVVEEGVMYVVALYAPRSCSVAEALGSDWAWKTSASGVSGHLASSNRCDDVPHVKMTASDGATSFVEVCVTNTTKVSFDWRVSCEEPVYDDEDQIHYFDCLAFYVDGEPVDAIAGEVAWESRFFVVDGEGSHTICWAYVKDESDAEGEDCGYVANVVITPQVRISFSGCGSETGLAPSSVLLYKGEAMQLPDKGGLVWPRHRFLGWCADKGVLPAGSEIHALACDVEYVAVWEEKRLQAPSIAVSNRFAADRTQVKMTAVDGATVRYTLDGSDPTDDSPVYEGVFYVDRSCTIKAIACSDDWYASPVATAQTEKASYVITFSPGSHGRIEGEARQVVFYGEAAEPPLVLPDDWYEFDKWDKTFDRVTRSMTVTATYKLRDYRVAEIGCYGEFGFSTSEQGVAVRYFADATDGCAINIAGDEAWLELSVVDYCRITCVVECEQGKTISCQVDGEQVALLGSGRHAVDVTGFGDHVLRWSGEGGLYDFKIETASVLTFKCESGETGEVPAPIPMYDGDQVVLPTVGALSLAKHAFTGWSDGARTWAGGDVYDGVRENNTLVAVWSEKHLEKPTIIAPDFYDGEKVTVEIAAQDDVTVLYTLDGRDPKAYGKTYAGPFEVVGTSTVKAIACGADWFDSDVAVKTLTRGPYTFGEYLGLSAWSFECAGDADWVRAKGEGPDGGYALRSGAIGDSQVSRLSVMFCGKGVLCFDYRVSSEAKKGVISDGIAVYLDGSEEKFWIVGGDVGWSRKEIVFDTEGDHSIIWEYFKNRQNAVGEDCAWLANATWNPAIEDDPIPVLETDANAASVKLALGGSVDDRIFANIMDVKTYNAYREWAMKIGAADVKASPFAWASFATDSAALLAKMPTDDDLKVEEFKPSTKAGAFDFTVSVEGVTIGDKAIEDNLKKLFGLEGAESLDSAAFSSENVALEFKEPQEGKLTFTATPAVNNAKSFFMKVKVK